MTCGVCGQGTKRRTARRSPAGVCPGCGLDAPEALARVVQHWNGFAAGRLRETAPAETRFCAAAVFVLAGNGGPRAVPEPAVLVRLLGSGGAEWGPDGVVTTALENTGASVRTSYGWEVVRRVVCNSVAYAAISVVGPILLSEQMEELMQGLESSGLPVEALASAILGEPYGIARIPSLFDCDAVLTRAGRPALAAFRDSCGRRPQIYIYTAASLGRLVEAATWAFEWAPLRRAWVAAVARGVARRRARAAPGRRARDAASPKKLARQ